MPDDQGDISGQSQTGQPVSNETQSPIQSPHVKRDVVQSGNGNVTVDKFSGGEFHQGDRHYHYGVSIGELRTLLDTYKSQSSQVPEFTNNSDSASDNLSFIKIDLDPSTLKAINAKLDIIEEIAAAGCFTDAHQQELNQLKQRLQIFQTLNQDLQQLAKQGDRLIQSAIDDMRRQIKNLQIDGEAFIEDARAQLSSKELECRKAENQNLEELISRLEASRLGAAWIDDNMNSLKKYACKQVLKQFPELDLSEQKIDDFQFSLKQFLEQIIFCLYRETYDILDSPDIPFELDVEQYEAAFLAIKKSVPPRLGSETVHAIEACLNYLIKRLPFIDSR